VSDKSIGELYERLLKARLEEHLYSIPQGISEHQFGFTKGKSTTQAIIKVIETIEWAGTGQLYNKDLCVLVSLDVANAFNTEPWLPIDEALIAKGVPNYLIKTIRSYLRQNHTN